MKIRKISQKQEKEVAEQFKGKTTIASGALWFQKSDVISDKCNLECKTTSKNYYSVSANVWEKIEKESIKNKDKIPLLIVDLVFRHKPERYVIFKDKYFEKSFSYEVYLGSTRNKSYRIYGEEMFEIYPVDALNFKIWGMTEHDLYCMPISTFIDIFGRELNL